MKNNVIWGSKGSNMEIPFTLSEIYSALAGAVNGISGAVA